MEVLFATTLALITGLATAAQGPTNAALGKHVGAVEASMVSFAGGLIILGILCPIVGQGNFLAIFTAEPWKWLAGLYGSFIVFSMAYCTPHLGAALCLTLFMMGQLTGGVIIDGFGLLETAPVAISPLRVIGCLCVFAGILLVYFGRKKQDKADGETSKDKSRAITVCVAISLLAGFASAVQTPTNAAMSAIAGTLESSTLNFIIGFTVMLIATLIVNRGRINSLRGIKAWKFTGGVYGAIGVPCITIATPILGVSLALCGLMVAQLVGAIFVDAFGWFETRKMHVDRLRVIGALFVALGVLLVTLSKL